MSSGLLHPPAHLSPAVALQLSQQAPLILRDSPSSQASLPFSLFTKAESPETWIIYENLIFSCLRTGDDKCAHSCLERLTDRFGAENERIMGLRGMYDEAVAPDETALLKILKEYEDFLAEDPINMPIAKRRAALLRSLSRPTEAIAALVQLLDNSPTDAEAWSELSDLYVSQGAYGQAIFCLEEVLLITPNAWNIHARLGEIVFIAADTSDSSVGAKTKPSVVEALRHFCRSVELCDDYLRGYYGIKLATNKLLSPEYSNNKHPSTVENPSEIPSTSIQALNQRATSKLSDIIRKNSMREAGWLGYDKAEVIAARELLNRDQQSIER